MPEIRFRVRWPDGSCETFYSPSLVIKEFFDVGARYPLADFVARSRTAFGIAVERVREKYGFRCPRALDALARIEAQLRNDRAVVDATVVVEAFEEAETRGF